MSGAYVLGRLIWRPAALLMLWALGMAALGATWDLAHGPVDLISDALAGFQSSLDVRRATWRLATLVPAISGVLLSFIGRELQHSLYGWTLPGLASGLRNGKLAAGLLIAALIATLVARISGAELASAAFGWALLCFALGGVGFDPVLPRIESRGVPAILALLVLRPVYLDQVGAWHPLIFGALSAIVAVLLIRREYSSAISRLRPLAGPSSMWATGPSGTQQYWLRRSVPERELNAALDTDSLSNWLRAGYYETYGGARRGWAGVALLQVSVAMVLAYFTDNPQMVVVMTWVMVGTSMTQLRAKFLYPMSRARRATLFVASTVGETLAASALALAAVLILLAVGPRTAAPPGTSPLELASFFVFFIAWAPLGHWAKIREPWTGDGSMSARRAARFFGFQIAYMLVAMTFAAQFQRFAEASATSWVAVAALTAGIYAIYWLAVQHYYRTRDLIFART
ncbi:MAG: hypothetical protein ABIV11_06405 [Gemmatimonadaceae bacterium]